MMAGETGLEGMLEALRRQGVRIGEGDTGVILQLETKPSQDASELPSSRPSLGKSRETDA